MGRIRLRVRDIDYPEPKIVIQNENFNKSNRSQSPRSNVTKGNKTNISSNRKDEGENSIVDVNDIELNQQIEGFNGEGNIGLDGGIEIVRSPSFLNRLDVQTIKDIKSNMKKSGRAKSDIGAPQMTNIIKQSSQASNASNQSAMVCRICLDYDNGIIDNTKEDFNPMISPCHCSGTMGGIHLKCLREWLERNKTIKAVKGHVIIKYKKVNCELCK